jgi:hypothetical protein
MTKSWRTMAAVIVVAVVACVSACKSRTKPAPVTVRIFRDLNSPYALELDRRILEFQGSNPRLSNGAAVQVGSLNIADYRGEVSKSAVSNMDDPTVEIVILNSPQDALNFPALQGELPHAVNVCAAVQACPAEVPALVPSKLGGDRAEAANKFVQFLAEKK